MLEPPANRQSSAHGASCNNASSMRDSRSANGRIPDPFARDEIDSPRVTDRVYGRQSLAKHLDYMNQRSNP